MSHHSTHVTGVEQSCTVHHIPFQLQQQETFMHDVIVNLMRGHAEALACRGYLGICVEYVNQV